MSNLCLTCGGLIAEPGVAYGYAGKFCFCLKEPQICRPTQQQTISVRTDKVEISTSPDTKLGVDEFDEQKASDAFYCYRSEVEVLTDEKSWIKGAKWQFEKLRPVIHGLRDELAWESQKAENEQINAETFEMKYEQVMRDMLALTDEIQTLKAENERLKNPVLKIGQYEIREFHNGNYWITHESGEGMEVSKDKLESLITQFYADNF